jgi:hypothetical protein
MEPLETSSQIPGTNPRGSWRRPTSSVAVGAEVVYSGGDALSKRGRWKFARRVAQAPLAGRATTLNGLAV